MLIGAPNELSPRLTAKSKKNAVKHGKSKKQDWKDWNTFSDALINATPLQLSTWSSFEEFRLAIANHKTYDHMRVWIDVFLTGQNSRYLRGIAGQDTLILAPRESSKSTVLAQFIAYQIGLHAAPWTKVALKVLWISYNITTALPRSRQIQAIIQSTTYRKIFPWVRPSKEKWSAEEWMIDLEHAGLSTTEEQYSFVCGGLYGGLNSRRAMLVAYDDLIKSPESIKSQSVRDAMISTVENVVGFCCYDGSRSLVLGTQMAANDIYCTQFTEEKKWKVIRQSALLEHPDGTEYSYWEPEDENAPGTPLRRLQEEREDKPIAFSFQRQNKVVRVKEQSINPGLIVRGTIPTRFDSLVLGCDLSAGRKESNDYTAMVLGGLVRGIDKTPDEYWVVDSWEDRIMGNLEKLDIVIEMWEMWSHLLPTTKIYNPEIGEWESRPEMGLNLFFDSSAYGLSLQGDYEDYIVGQKKIVDWRVHPVPASGRGDKLYRLRKHTGLFTNKLVKFNLYGRTMGDGRRPMGRLIQQITEFGSTSHDDLADAFELCMTGLRSYLPMSKGNY